MSDWPLASICIPLYNKGAHIAQTLESVLAQTYPNLEVVVSDNGSNDGSTEVARDFAARDPRVKYYRLHHTVSMNESFRYCYQLAQGTYVNLHSADDTSLAPDFLQAMVEPMLTRPEIGFTVCEVNPVIGHTVPGMSGDGLINCFRGIAARCRELCNMPDRDQRARLLLACASLENQLGSFFAVVARKACLPYKHWKKAAYSWAEAYPDWDFMIRMFLEQRGFFVENVKFTFHYDAGSPFWRTYVDHRVELYDKMWRLMMPITIIADPDMAELRQHARPEDLRTLAQQIQNRLAQVMDVADRVSTFDRPTLTVRMFPRLQQLGEAFRANPNDLGALTPLRQLRNELVRHWLSFAADETATGLIANELAGSTGQAHRSFHTAGVTRIPLDEFEQGLLNQAVQRLQGGANPGAILAVSLLTSLQTVGVQVESLPAWLQPFVK
ncbi:MAG: glycosyltransferase family 2 protein [Planctomycetaceae bacterium]|nr:glycosyltransferase family 2 protein [Planctomycetaceae bacterium]